MSLVDKAAMHEIANILLSEIPLWEKLAELDDYFFQAFSTAIPNTLILNTLDRIFYSGGSFSVKDLAIHEAVSERHLNRLFDLWIGISPKAFSRVIRFQRLLSSWYENSYLRVGNQADQVYYDQSHLIKDFKAFCGGPPSRFFNAGQ